MQLNYELTLDDYKAVLRLHRRQKIGRFIYFIAFYRLIPVAAVLFLTLTFVALAHHKPHQVSILFPLDAGFLWVAIALPIARAFNIRKCFKQLFPPTRLGRASSIEINEDGIQSRTPGIGEGKVYWSGILRFAQNEEVTMLYLSESRFLFFPTQAMSPAQRAELNDLVAHHVVKR